MDASLPDISFWYFLPGIGKKALFPSPEESAVS
jgi:hypothetical protein